MLFYDIEVFPKYWCVVVVDDETETRYVFEDVPSLREFYKANRDQTWVGYNSRQYDAPMLRFIMLGLDPYECSYRLIVRKMKWFQFPYNIVEQYKRIPLKNFDCILPFKGLKKLEAFRGSSIVETSIPFDTDRVLTREEKDEIIFYCTHDVLETRKVFYDTHEEYEAHEGLISAFDLDPSHFNKTKAQLAALILDARKQERFDEWQFPIVDTLKVEKYKEIVEWYVDPSNHDYNKKLDVIVSGVHHVFAWGGLHGARSSYYGQGIFINMDVASYYPALMIEYNFLSRNVLNPAKYKEIRDYRIILKANKDPRQLPYKIVLNGTYGAMKDKFNNLYDPRQANAVCVNGQLLLLDLIEKLEGHCELVQSNTDGILVRVDNEEQVEIVKAISQEWSKRTRMELEYDRLTKVFQKDVNNYLTVDEKGKIKSKGAWAKTWLKEKKLPDGTKIMVDDLTDYDLVILREALHNYFAKGISVEDTINQCDDLIKFQKIVMISGKFKHAIHGRFNKKTKEFVGDYDVINEKHLRVFASTDDSHGGIFKRHAIRDNINQAADTPEHCFLVNSEITGLKVSNFPLDKQYYIDMAKKRIKAFCQVTA